MNKRPILYLAFLCVLAVQSPVFGQTVSPDQATMIDSFGNVPNGDLRGRLDIFLATLQNHPSSNGLVYVYGTAAQVAARTRLVRNHIGFRRFAPSRVSFISGRNVGYVRSDLWIVPSGASEPDPKPESWIYKEIGSSNKSVLSVAMKTVVEESSRLGNHGTHIINYGTVVQVAQRERWIRNALAFHRFDSSRTTIVNGGPGPVRTVMWLVPPGAANPTP